MGWFSSSSSSPAADKPASIEAPKASNDGGYIAPDRSQRALCWEGRDGFFACLDRNNIVDSVKESEKAARLCAKENQVFEKNCATSWVCCLLLAVAAWMGSRAVADGIYRFSTSRRGE